MSGFRVYWTDTSGEYSSASCEIKISFGELFGRGPIGRSCFGPSVGNGFSVRRCA